MDNINNFVNVSIIGVFFDNRIEHIKFVDFCGKYRVPLLQYLCSSKYVFKLYLIHIIYDDLTNFLGWF